MDLVRLLRTSSFRLTLLYAGLFGLSVLILFGVIYETTAGYLSRQLDASVAAEIEELRGAAAAGDPDRLRTAVTDGARHAPPGLHYLLENADGAVLAGDLPALPPLLGAVDLGAESLLGKGRFPHDLHGRGVQVGTLYLLVARDDSQLEELRELIARAFVWSLAATIVLAIGGGMLLSASVLRRVEAISRISREIVDGNLARRIPVSNTNDEFDHLAVSFNTMLHRIQALLEGLRQVSSDVAHDLRTPLTRLRHRLELARRKAGTVEELQAVLDASLVDVDGILDIFSALLRIAQIEAGTRKAGFAMVDLTELLLAMVEVYEPVAEEKAQRLSATIAPGIQIQGDRELLMQMISNLIENAIHHSPPDTAIILASVPRGSAVDIVIADTGPGIPAEQRSQVFQRFFRLEASRTTPGSGLGLSLVGAVAALHGIAVRLDDNRPGLIVTLSLPAQSDVRSHP